ncbi:hypothetical protein C9I57_23800 [Trinickia symbiotica]|uniref:Uncharacterized protein n=1 Tax=Trinickia symbiotica TaxID=863227 RepID=A0A2T3XNX2_9BURK|nr:hypothetical protein C9I57_23800 [Trinickia symbiotica]
MSATYLRRRRTHAPRARLQRLRKAARRGACWAGAAALMLSIGGCGLAAFPCRVVSATLKVVPGVGDVAATPFDTCASAID